MIRTHIFPCSLDKARADLLNRESGRIYTGVKVEHYRIYRQTGHWLSQSSAEKLNDYLSGTILHAHSRDAAQQAFYKACKTARTNRGVVAGSRYPHRNKGYRTTIWKNTGIRKQKGTLLLALARASAPVVVSMPPNLAPLSQKAFLEMRLVWDRAARHYFWHVVVEDGQAPAASPGGGTAGVDLGEIHPAAATDGKEAVVFSCRELRSISQYTNKRLASIQEALSRKERNSRRYRRLVARKTRFLAKQKRRKQDLEHKISRQVVNWAVERGVSVLAVGDVRNAADGVKKGKVCNQKIANWTHGKVRRYIQYKAEAAGIGVELVKEHYTSQTCPACGHRHKPKGRDYICPACGFCGHRDIVGAVNILSRQTCGDVGKISPPADTKYRYPFQRVMRSRPDTADMARIREGFPEARSHAALAAVECHYSCTVEEYTAITDGLTDYVTDNVQDESGFRISLAKDGATAEVSRMTDAEGNPVHGQLVLRMSVSDHNVETWGDSAEQINRAIKANFGIA